MTLTEYNNQVDPQRLSFGEVLLDESEVNFRLKTEFNGVVKQQVFIKGYPYEYMIEIYSYSSDRKHTLYTTDEDGNKKSLSVFSVKLNIK
jgi:hypothetical protein